MNAGVLRRPARFAVRALLVGSVAIVGAAGCGRAPTGVGRTARVEVGVQFATGAGPALDAIPAGVDSMEFTSWAEAGGREQQLSSQAFHVDATTTEIQLDLRVPLATGYRVTASALGIRDRVGNPTLYGIQFYRSQRLDAGLGPAVSLELTLEDVVPQVVRFQVPTGDSLSWSPVPAARSYLVRAYNASGGPPVDFATSGTAMILPFGTGSFYRVSSDLGSGVLSAFSEIP